MRWQWRPRLLFGQLYRAPGYVEVYGEAVPLPAPIETGWGGLSIDEADVLNAAEHDGGCHGPDCDGRCAEEVYARWSWLYGGDAPAYASPSSGGAR